MEYEGQVELVSDLRISAIYYALLQTGYDFYAMEKEADVVQTLRGFAGQGAGRFPFFEAARQTTCQEYPYWPRAFLLEAASFHLKEDCSGFRDLNALRRKILSAGNLSPEERGQALWDWLREFPLALMRVRADTGFQQYWVWEAQWLAGERGRRQEQLEGIQRCLEQCARRYQPPVQAVKIILNPIKCAYSSDYHWIDGCFYFSSGALRGESVIHEFLHPVVHPAVERNQDALLRRERPLPGIDDSYYLDRSGAGWLNACEEYCVRALTQEVMAQNYPVDLDAAVLHLIESAKLPV